MREAMYKFLMGFGFKVSTLDLLTDRNLEILADQYRFNPAYKQAITK
jgi:hypothetical protein